ncbi:hypothetical protein OBBRIDRAFT_731038 [Obba rivulosa]|uniref:Peptidase A2 domain-containing protein n=1 Tax=Obba rivulosa TaxID=1052685 RepID=A0A8E2B2W8_9APHY|nr:hypothetical protein OBBRIDRAFT_731038 [Obba rivulosa]
MWILGQLTVKNQVIELITLIDSGAQTNLIHPDVVTKYKLPRVKLLCAVIVQSVNNTLNQNGNITHQVESKLQLRNKVI